MRQGQQNRRGRGRSNNNNNNNNNSNRKNQNPLSRSFESNGPDVKIRGTPAHIAEKYITLARDAHSSGDHVLAENYLQHAEHYTRIIMAYREQFAPHGDGMNGHRHQPQDGSGTDDFSEDDSEDILDETFQNSQPHVQQFAPQPQPAPQRQQGDGNRSDGNRGEGNREMRDNRDNNRDRDQQRGDRQPFRRDQGRFRDRNPDRGDRQDHRPDRPERPDRAERSDRPLREDRGPVARDERPPAREDRAPAEHAAEPPEPRRARERFQQPHEQPDFLRRPVRRPRSESPETPAVSKDETPRGD